jgi:tetratricopeptide (TPR) repeat protein
VRADTRINQIVMDATPKNGQVLGIDAAEVLAVQSPKGIPGKTLFNEHVHYTVEGNFMLARIIADQVSPLLPPEIRVSQTENWLEHEACNRQLALTVWDQVRLWDAESIRVNTMPFTSQTGNRANKDHIHAKKKAILAGVTKNTAMQDLQLYESALERTPEDTLLIGNYAQFLDGMGMTVASIEQAERFRTLLPNAWTEYYMAALLAKSGRLKEAEACLEKALEMNSDLPQAQKLLKQIR